MVEQAGRGSVCKAEITFYYHTPIKRYIYITKPSMLNIDQEIFNKNLLLTQVYCEMQLTNAEKSPAEILRGFNPEYNGKPIFSFERYQYNQFTWNTTIWAIDPQTDHINGYQCLFDKQLERKSHLVTDLEEQSAYEGRILIANIYESVWDGASEAQSDGLVDGYDCPPIDTWFYIGQGENGPILFAWIPGSFENLAQGAIDVNCTFCLWWYDEGRFNAPRDFPESTNQIDKHGYQYSPHEKYVPDRRYIFPIVCAVLLLIILLACFNSTI
jgi:hypothetical protein